MRLVNTTAICAGCRCCDFTF